MVVPGLGHILLKRWARGGLIFLSVSIIFCRRRHAGKCTPLTLGNCWTSWLCRNFGNGIFYFAAEAMDWAPVTSTMPPPTTAPSSSYAAGC